MNEQSYWTRKLRGRVSRRQVMVTTSGAAFSAAFLAACGGDDDSSSSGSTGSSPTATTASSGSSGTSGATGSSGASGSTGATGATNSLLSKREDTSARAVPGGTLLSDNVADVPQFDPHLLSLPGAMAVSLIFNKLFSIVPGVLEQPTGEIEGDLAESWEFSPDNLTLTAKLRQDTGLPPQQLGGRKLDAEDVVFSWNRWAAQGSNRQDLVNSVNPAAPVLSLEATDNSTIVIKLKEPVASILAGFSSQLQGQMFVVPKEADGGFDVAKDPMGFGAYYLDEYLPSSRLSYKRNTNSADKLAYPDAIETPIITETAQVNAQLSAGNVYVHSRPNAPESVLQIKKDQDKIGLYQTPIANVGVTTFFGFKADPPEKTPFRDERVRQAWSRSMDRDLFLDTFANVSKFESQGLPVDTAWNSALAPSDYAGWWLDPQSADFGDNAKYFKYDIAEAKKLLSAAGFPDGLDVDSNEAAGTNYGLTYAPQVEAIHGMASDAGFKINRLQFQAPAPWNSEFRDSHGYFEGIAFRLTPVPAEPRDGAFALYNVNGSLNYGFDPDGKGIASKDGPYVGDPTCDDLTSKLRGTFDNDEAIAIAHQLQQYLGGKQYFSRALASASGFDVAWPVLRNYSVFQGLAWGYSLKRYWIDKTQAPLA